MTRYYLLFLVIAFGSILPTHANISVSADEPHSVPAGIYVLNRPGIDVSEALLSSELITGIVLRGNWPEIEPEPNMVLTDYYLEQLDKIHAAGKVASLVINNGGVNTPDHVLKHVSQTITFENKNRFHKTHGESVTIPVFWNEHLLTYKKKLVEAVARKLQSHPALKIVSVQCANATTDDWNIPTTNDWQRIGFSDAKLVSACQSIIDHTAKHFPNQALRMAIGPVPRELSPHRQSVSRKIVQYVRKHYSERFYLQRHNLSTRTPIASENNRLFGWQLIYDARPFSAAQLLWPSTDEKSCRLNGGRKPCSSEKMLEEISSISESYGFRYVEIYGADFQKLSDSSTLSRLSKTLRMQQVKKTTSLDMPKKNRPNAHNSSKRKDIVRRQSPINDIAVDSYGSWYNPPPKNTKKKLTRHYAFNSDRLGEQVGYSLYLPTSEQAKHKPFPVIYWLHGKKGNESRGTHIADYLDHAISLGHIRPTAMVFVNGGQHSFYADSFNGEHPVESMIIEELIPHIEATYPVSSKRKERLLEGFSMGGFGALKLAAKFPDKFGSVAIFGAALLDKTFMPRQADASAFENVFNKDKAYFVRNTPLFWLEENKKRINDLGVGIRIRSGSKDGTRRYNKHMHKQLNNLNIPHDYVQYEGVNHAPRQYYDADEFGSFKFHEQSMSDDET